MAAKSRAVAIPFSFHGVPRRRQNARSSHQEGPSAEPENGRRIPQVSVAPVHAGLCKLMDFQN